MQQRLLLAVEGANTYSLALPLVEGLQEAVADEGGAAHPVFARIGRRGEVALQPVTARALLAEVEAIPGRLRGVVVPALLFLDASLRGLGGLYQRRNQGAVLRTEHLELSATANGICIRSRQVPPPVGFRSRPGLPSGTFECFFEALLLGQRSVKGKRTVSMGGSGALVDLPPLTLPPAARWDFSEVSGNPAVQQIAFAELSAAQVFAPVLHAFTAACNDSIRLRRPLHVRIE